MKILKENMKGKFIKIKIKYILVVLATIFIIIPNAIIGISYTLFSMDWRLGEENLPISYYTQGLLNIYVKLPKISPFDNTAYYIMGKNYYDYENNFIIINSGGYGQKGSRIYTAKDGLKKAIECHKNGNKGNGKSSFKNAIALINLYTLNNEKDRAIDIIEELKKSRDLEIKNIGVLNEAIIEIKNQNYDEALNMLENIDEQYYKILNVERIKGNIYIAKGEEKKAIEALELSESHKVYVGQRKYRDINLNFLKTTLQFNDYGWRKEDDINKVMNIKKNNIIKNEYRQDIKGTFKLDGKLMKGALIKIEKTNSFNLESYIEEYPGNLISYSYVNSEGEFTLHNIAEGIYEMSIILPYEKALESQIDLKYGVSIIEMLEVKREENRSNNKILIEKSKNGNYLEINYTNEVNEEENKNIEEEANEEDIYENIEGKIEEGERTIKVTSTNKKCSELNKLLYFYGNVFDDIFKNENTVELSKEFLYKGGYSIESEFKNEMILRDETDNFTDFILFGKVNKEKINRNFNEEEKTLINKFDFKALQEYYKEKYKAEKDNILFKERLLKLYVTGYNTLGEGKDVNKAINLNKEILEQDKNLESYNQRLVYINAHYNRNFNIKN